MNGMKLFATELPSRGFDSDLAYVSLTPMTYDQMIKYDEGLKLEVKDKFHQLISDIELLKADNPEIDKLNYYDLDSVVYLKKLISVTDSPILTIPDHKCPFCDKSMSIKVNSADLSSKPLDEDLLKSIESVKLGGKIFHIILPKVGDVRKAADKLIKYHVDMDFKLFQILCILDFERSTNDAVDAIKNATKDEVMLLEYLHSLFINPPKISKYNCQYCGKEHDVEVLATMTSLFRLLNINSAVPKGKIILRK